KCQKCVRDRAEPIDPFATEPKIVNPYIIARGSRGLRHNRPAPRPGGRLAIEPGRMCGFAGPDALCFAKFPPLHRIAWVFAVPRSIANWPRWLRPTARPRHVPIRRQAWEA